MSSGKIGVLCARISRSFRQFPKTCRRVNHVLIPARCISEKMNVSRFPVLDEDKIEELPEDIKERMKEVQRKAGFLPNVFKCFSHRPDEFRGFFNYYDALMESEGPLTKAEREMIVVATSAINSCTYCVVAHGALLRIFSKNPLLGDQVAISYPHADITDRQKAMLDFAVEVAKGQPIRDDTISSLSAQGFSDREIWDIGAIAAFFSMSNRMAHVANMRPNDEFYMMGRVTKEKLQDPKD